MKLGHAAQIILQIFIERDQQGLPPLRNPLEKTIKPLVGNRLSSSEIVEGKYELAVIYGFIAIGKTEWRLTRTGYIAAGLEPKVDPNEEEMNATKGRAGKKPTEAQRRRQKIKDFLAEHGPAGVKAIVKGLGMEPRKVSEDLNILKDDPEVVRRQIENNIYLYSVRKVETPKVGAKSKRKRTAATETTDSPNFEPPEVVEPIGGRALPPLSRKVKPNFVSQEELDRRVCREVEKSPQNRYIRAANTWRQLLGSKVGAGDAQVEATVLGLCRNNILTLRFAKMKAIIAAGPNWEDRPRATGPT